MTDIHTQMLEAFFADRDVATLRDHGLATFGVDITAVYCQHTGKKVGTFDDSVIQFAIDEENTDDDDSLIEALFARTVASMRPSPMLNKPDRVTLLNLAAKYPVDVCTYLINRLHSNRWLATHRNFEILDPYVARIHAYSRWESLAAAGVDLSPWIHWLLELDAKRNLHDLTPPCIALDKLNNWFLSAIGDSLFYLVTADNHSEMLAAFEQWTFGQLAEFDRRDSQALAQDKWMRGNSLSQPAYVRSWMENPQFASKRAEASAKAKGNLKVGGKEKSPRATKLDAKVSQFLHLLDGIIDNAPAVTPKKAAPKMLTGGMLFAKKESN